MKSRFHIIHILNQCTLTLCIMVPAADVQINPSMIRLFKQIRQMKEQYICTVPHDGNPLNTSSNLWVGTQEHINPLAPSYWCNSLCLGEFKITKQNLYKQHLLSVFRIPLNRTSHPHQWYKQCSTYLHYTETHIDERLWRNMVLAHGKPKRFSLNSKYLLTNILTQHKFSLRITKIHYKYIKHTHY